MSANKYIMHGKRKTRLYRIWANIKTRCYNERDPHFERWGNRGITMCDEWKNSYNEFKTWAENNGYKEDIMPNYVKFAKIIQTSRNMKPFEYDAPEKNIVEQEIRREK